LWIGSRRARAPANIKEIHSPLKRNSRGEFGPGKGEQLPKTDRIMSYRGARSIFEKGFFARTRARTVSTMMGSCLLKGLNAIGIGDPKQGNP